MIVPNADLTFARETLRSFMDAVALTRALSTLKPEPYSFRVAQNAAFDTAVINWCILFGSDHADHQKIHWKNLFETNAFRDGLLGAVRMTRDEFQAYQKMVVDYRNELAAHRDLNPDTTHHPNFETALVAADFYHERLREKIKSETGAATDGGTLLDQFGERSKLFADQMGKALKALKT